MRAIPVLIAVLSLAATPVLAEQAPPRPHHPKPGGPEAIGTYEDWTAATNREAGQTVCYAFTRARSSSPAVPGRDEVVLTVTERPSGRDAVALSGGFAFPANAEVKVATEGARFAFYTAQRSAFARDGHAVVQAFKAGREVTTRAPGPKGAEVVDTFSLEGFSAAYAAIEKHCPPGKAAP